MLTLSLYGFEFYLIKNQYVLFYFERKLPHNSIFSEGEAVKITCRWIDEQRLGYDGPTSKQFKEAYDRLER